MAGTSSWKLDVDFSFETLLDDTSFITLKYGPDGTKMFTLCIRTKNLKLTLSDWVAMLARTFDKNTGESGPSYFVPTVNTLYTMEFVWGPPVLQMTLSDHTRVIDSIAVDFGLADLGQVVLYNGYSGDGTDYVTSNFGGKIWTSGFTLL